MFGIYRYVLAWMVVFAHAWGPLAGRTNWFGLYAVFAFYLLSGYLMTLVLVERYGHTPAGLARYLGNRFLRIYPPYFVVLLAALLLIWVDPTAAYRASPFLGWPRDLQAWIANFSIVGLHLVNVKLVPTAWTLSVEVLYYIAMGLLLTRSRSIVHLWLAASVVWTIVAVAQGWGMSHRISTVQGASLPFALGASICLLRGRTTSHALLTIAAIAFAANVCLAGWFWKEVFGAPLYISTALGGLLVYLLRGVSSRKPWLRNADQLAGDLAYPIFLCHHMVFACLIKFAFDGVRPPRETLLLVAIPSVHFAAYVLHHSVASRHEPVRDRLRVATGTIRKQRLGVPAEK